MIKSPSFMRGLQGFLNPRSFSTSRFVQRIVPYYPKGTWKLPSAVSTPVTEEISEIKPIQVNVPKNWRSMKHLPQWKRQMFALQEKFPAGWAPKRKLSREKIEELRAMKKAMPELTTVQLGQHYRISPEAVRRILRSSWKPTEKEEQKIAQRWHKRGERLKGDQ